VKNDEKDLTKWICLNDEKPLSTVDEVINNLYQTRGVKQYDKSDIPTELKENAKKIAKTVLEDMEADKRILLWGDYDVDGTSSVLIWVYTFMFKKYTNFGIHIPERTDGYGLSIYGLNRFAKNYDTVITMDNGITAGEEAIWCKQNRIKLIVTDHHSFTKENRTTAPYIFNPHDYEENYCSDLCGASISHLITTQIAQDVDIVASTAFFASMGIIGDVVPLKGYNRLLFTLGREALFLQNIPCFIALRKKLKLSNNKKLNAVDFAFGINPLVNACGRMGNIRKAVNFFCAKADEAETLLKGIMTLNVERRMVEKEQTELALTKIKLFESIATKPKNQLKHKHYLHLVDPKFHPGMMGLIAGKVAEVINKPVLLMRGYRQPAESRYVYEGSGRCYNGIPLLSVLRHIEHLFIKLGGHEQAFGFMLLERNIDRVTDYLDKELRKSIYKQIVIDDIPYDANLTFPLIDLPLAQKLRDHEPFGKGFTNPVYRIVGRIYEIRVSETKTGKHSFVHIINEETQVRKINFFFKDLEKSFEKDEKVEALFSMGTSMFINQEQLALKGLEIRPLDEKVLSVE